MLTARDLTNEERQTAKGLVSALTSGGDVAAMRAAMRDSRNRHGDDRHEIIKGLALSVIANGKA